MGEKILKKPGLRERAEKQVWKMIDAFEKELLDGKVALDLFTQDELVLPFMRLQAEFGEQFIQSEPTEEKSSRVFNTVRETINEIMKPERLESMRSDVRQVATTWMRERYKWGPALQAELHWLEDPQYEENKFVLAAFFGQLKRSGETQKPANKVMRRFTLFGR